MPAYCNPRGRLDQSRRRRRHAPEISRSRSDPDRIWRRQPRGDVLARARRSYDLRHRRCGWRQDPVQGGPGITRSDLLVINKIDLAPYVGASLDVMERDARRMRATRPFVMTNLRDGRGIAEIARFVEEKGGLAS